MPNTSVSCTQCGFKYEVPDFIISDDLTCPKCHAPVVRSDPEPKKDATQEVSAQQLPSCPYCGKPIRHRVIKCRHCKNPIVPWELNIPAGQDYSEFPDDDGLVLASKSSTKTVNRKKVIKGIAIAFITIVIGSLFFSNCSSDAPPQQSISSLLEASSSSSRDLSRDKDMAWIKCKRLVGEHLVSPRTAKWPYDPIRIVENNDGSFTITAYVDSENYFGAKIRTHFTATVTGVGGGGMFWTLVSLETK